MDIDKNIENALKNTFNQIEEIEDQEIEDQKIKDQEIEDQEIGEITEGVDNLEIYDPKIDQLFKTIFGQKENQHITKRFLKDLIDLEVKENESINFTDKEIILNEYKPDQKRPIVDINIEIESLLNNINDQNEENLKTNINDQNEDNFITTKRKKNKVEKSIPKKILVEMQVFNDSNFLNRIMYNVCALFVNLYHKGDSFETRGKIISLNFLYENKFRLSKEKNSNYFHYFNVNCKDIDKKYENIDIYIIELSRFNINDFEDTDKNLWIAFLKCITYEKREFEENGVTKTEREPINHLIEIKGLYDKLIKINEIKEAINLCKVKPVNYDNYKNLFNVDLEISKLNQELEETKEELDEANEKMKKQDEKIKEQEKIIEELKRKYVAPINDDDDNKKPKFQ